MTTKNSKTKDAFLTIKISSEDKELLKAAARLDDRTLSNWSVRHLVRLAKQELAESDG